MTPLIAIGQILEVERFRNVTATYVVDSYNDQNYMKLINTNCHSDRMTIHPAHVKRIANNPAGDSGIKMLT
jgi:hypothetical protein